MNHKVALFIINNPRIRKQEYIALVCGVDRKTVWNTMQQLNIPTRRKPDNYVG